MTVRAPDRPRPPNAPARSGHRPISVVLLTVAALVAGTLGWWWGSTGTTVQCENDAITAEATTALRDWGEWLSQFGAQGVVGEVGWPSGGADEGAWQRLAARWLEVADDPTVGTGVYVWAAGQQWRPSYPLAVYRSRDWSRRDGVLDTGGPIARILESHLPSELTHGVALADGAFGASFEDGGRYSAARPGILDEDYRYPSTASLTYLREQGILDLRLAVTWERLQPTLFGPLDDDEVAQVVRVVKAAARNAQRVVIDLHNFGRYMVDDGGVARALVLGSAELPAAALADFWSRLAQEIGTTNGVAGYGLMNEPHDLPQGAATWQEASSLAVAAIRQHDTSTPVLVGGYDWSSLEEWQTWHPVPWIVDPHVVYEAHQYMDADRRGVYPRSYAQENAAAEASGWTPCGRDLLTSDGSA